MNDLVVRALSVGVGSKRVTSPSSPPNGVSPKFGRKAGGYGFVDGFDNIEEGGDMEVVGLHVRTATQSIPAPSVAGRRRVNIGRKKLD